MGSQGYLFQNEPLVLLQHVIGHSKRIGGRGTGTFDIMSNKNGNEENKLKVDCPACGQRFSVTVPQVEIVNTLKVSIIVATHEKSFSCLCGQKFSLGLLPAGEVAW